MALSRVSVTARLSSRWGYATLCVPLFTLEAKGKALPNQPREVKKKSYQNHRENRQDLVRPKVRSLASYHPGLREEPIQATNRVKIETPCISTAVHILPRQPKGATQQ